MQEFEANVVESNSHISSLNNQVAEMRVSLELYYVKCCRLKVEADKAGSKALAKYKASFNLMPNFKSMDDYLQSLAIKEARKLVLSKITDVEFEFLTELGVDDLDVERDSANFNSLETIEDLGENIVKVELMILQPPTSNLQSTL
ncbi:hypothetical protein Fot_22108 [Forsythia ovata]|uniref:Uncharacterized protein n=1 Tax=Forsythia ovata TaxID=205694 RepID=A0ABD1UX21_9LAMI